MNFTEWVDKELEAKGWTRAELARRAHISQSALSMIWSGERDPGFDICLAISRALDYPPEIVLRAAGLIPSHPDNYRVSEEILKYKIRELSDSQQGELLKYIDLMQDRDEHPDQRTSYKKPNREGATPPEVIKK